MCVGDRYPKCRKPADPYLQATMQIENMRDRRRGRGQSEREKEKSGMNK